MHAVITLTMTPALSCAGIGEVLKAHIGIGES
jgi:hypothetical protein